MYRGCSREREAESGSTRALKGREDEQLSTGFECRGGDAGA